MHPVQVRKYGARLVDLRKAPKPKKKKVEASKGADVVHGRRREELSAVNLWRWVSGLCSKVLEADCLGVVYPDEV